MSEKTLVLPVDLKERRMVLEEELKNTVSEQIAITLTDKANGLFEQYGIKGETAKITWEFHPESDDEGGTDWWASYVQLFVDGERIETEEKIVNRKSSYSDRYYDCALSDELSELINDHSSDLYQYDIESLETRIEN